jgi:hypothetical protein
MLIFESWTSVTVVCAAAGVELDMRHNASTTDAARFRGEECEKSSRMARLEGERDDIILLLEI